MMNCANASLRVNPRSTVRSRLPEFWCRNARARGSGSLVIERTRVAVVITSSPCMT